jgi:hypothetical protein
MLKPGQRIRLVEDMRYISLELVNGVNLVL